MNITIDFDPSCATSHVEEGRNIVVVDVLRATSTIIVALTCGAVEVIPCSEIGEARGQGASNSAILIGERHAEKIDGFDFTNSPYDIKTAKLMNRKVVLTTSTGTKLLTACSRARNILIASTLNSHAVAQKMKQIGGDWAVIGAGSRGEFRAEDKVGCALVSKYFLSMTEYSADRKTLDIVNMYSRNIAAHIRSSPSAIKLANLNRMCDVDFVIDYVNQYPLVPQATTSRGGYLTILKVI